MRAYARTGRSTGVSIGPIGLLFLGPFIGVYMMFRVFVLFGQAVASLFRGWR